MKIRGESDPVYYMRRRHLRRYTVKDWNRHRYCFCSRNVAAFDMQDAADYGLGNIPRALSEMEGVEIVDACWESEPKVSSFDPYIDRCRCPLE